MASILEQMKHSEKVMLFTMGTLRELVEKGMVVREGPELLTDKGWMLFQELKTSGFRPTTEEIDKAMDAIVGKGRGT